MKKKQIITKIISVGLAAGITLFGTSFFNGSKIVQADQVANGKTNGTFIVNSWNVLIIKNTMNIKMN